MRWLECIFWNVVTLALVLLVLIFHILFFGIIFLTPELLGPPHWLGFGSVMEIVREKRRASAV